MHMANLAMAMKKLPAEVTNKVKLVFVTTDPERDTPTVLRKWLDHFNQNFIGLTGSEKAVMLAQRATGVAVAQKIGASNGNYGVNHANFVVAYTKDNFAHVIYPGGVSKDDWVHDLPLLLQETWSGR